jgi:hypothetical protein
MIHHLQYFTVMNASDYLKTQKLQNYMIPEKIFFFMYHEKYMLLPTLCNAWGRWWSISILKLFYVFNRSIYISFFNASDYSFLTFLTSYMSGRVNELFLRLQPKVCNPVTHNGDKNDREREISTFTRFWFCNKWLTQKPLHLIKPSSSESFGMGG